MMTVKELMDTANNVLEISLDESQTLSYKGRGFSVMVAQTYATLALVAATERQTEMMVTIHNAQSDGHYVGEGPG